MKMAATLDAGALSLHVMERCGRKLADKGLWAVISVTTFA